MFTANDVKTLREKTGAGMMDCKKALQATEGSLEKAIDWLRENGAIKAAKKESRIAAEGTSRIVANDKKVVIIEVNSETDFVASNPKFTDAVELIANAILNSDAKTMDEANALVVDGKTINELMVELTATIGEKLSFRKFETMDINEGEVVGTYSHMGGKIGVIVKLKGGNQEVAKDVAMHVAAMNPSYVRREDVASDVLERESNVIKEQVMKEGKPEAIAEKMVVGRLNKFYKDICLAEQEFIKDSSMNVETYVKNNGGELVSMIRVKVGDGIEKREENFAEEVAAQISGN